MVAVDEFVRKVYERGKVTIPKELRDVYGVQDGDLVKLKIVRVVRAGEQVRQADAPGTQDASIDVVAQVDDDEATDAKEVA